MSAAAPRVDGAGGAAVASSEAARADAAEARRHAVWRLAVGVTLAFVACEVFGFYPSFLAPVLTAVLLANLPMRPPLKMAIGLVLIMTVAALFAYGAASLLRGQPTVLFGVIGLSLFLTFNGLLRGKPRVPAMLFIICISVIPIVVMVAPAQASILPAALIRAIAIALVVLWIVYAPWPRLPPRAPPPPAVAPLLTPHAMALRSTAVVLPLMLVFLLFGLADALPVMAATVMLVVNFDLEKSRMHALAMIFGNLAGGFLGLVLHWMLLTTPTLAFLTLLLLLVSIAFGTRIVDGGPRGAVALLTFNATLIVLSLALATGPASLTVWLTRLFQFALAGAFAVGVLTLALPPRDRERPPSPHTVTGETP